MQRQERVSGSVAGVGGAHEHPERDRLSGAKRRQSVALLPGHGGAGVRRGMEEGGGAVEDGEKWLIVGLGL